MTTIPSASSVQPVAGPSAEPWRFIGPASLPPRALSVVGFSYVSLLASALFGYIASGRGATAVVAIFATIGALALLGACLALFGLSYAFRAKNLTLLLLSVVALAFNAVLLRHSVVVGLLFLSTPAGYP